MLRFLLNSSSKLDDASSVATRHSLLTAYFDMLFAFVDQPTQVDATSSLTLTMKHTALASVHSFWGVHLSANLKRSLSLNETILKRLTSCLIANLYTQVLKHKEIFVELALTTQQSSRLASLIHLILKFLSEILSHTLDFKTFRDALFLHLMQAFVNKERGGSSSSKKRTGAFTERVFYQSRGKWLLDHLGEVARDDKGKPLFLSRHEAVLVLLRQCFEYHVLKEECECENLDVATCGNVTQIERFIFVYDLIKIVSKTSAMDVASGENCRSLSEAKRDVKMHLLEASGLCFKRVELIDVAILKCLIKNRIYITCTKAKKTICKCHLYVS